MSGPRANGSTDSQPLRADGRRGGQIKVICGPLINYQHMADENGRITWHGSILIVTTADDIQPVLQLKSLGATGVYNTELGQVSAPEVKPQTRDGLKLYQDPQKTFWKFSLVVPLIETEVSWEYTITDMRFESQVSASPSRIFVVPSKHESMRIMFHSCNGFSVGTDEDYWSGPALWKDVLRVHRKRPFHVMIGGGDQIYNDGVRVSGPLKKWTEFSNPTKRRGYAFDKSLHAECDQYYFENYVRWYSTEPFATANSAIPQINIWDDHDIIDGFGSYTDDFMRCPVFRGIGEVSFKYYCLFQHHTAPPRSSVTSDTPFNMIAEAEYAIAHDSQQTKNPHVYTRIAEDPSWIFGKRPGPYIEERSRSIYARLGKRIAFVGIDARTERTRKQVNYPDTYDLIFERLRHEIVSSRGDVKHLILLLGVPIAYPRLAWLENLFTSPIVAPMRLLNKRFGFAGGLFNEFDGSIDLLDDLDDHYTSKHHKAERKRLILRLQDFAREFSVRVTVLGGDVHLAAVGRFYSNPKAQVDATNDHRYMANIISSAITNKPPPKAVANLLARRNKIHHLRDGHTDETLLNLFDKQPGGRLKGADWNQCTMPSRNYAIISEVPGEFDWHRVSGSTNGKVYVNGANGKAHLNGTNGSATVNGTNGSATVNGTNGSNTVNDTNGSTTVSHSHGKHSPRTKIDGHSPLHAGEEGVGTIHAAADGISNSTAIRGGLDVCIRVEIDNSDREGRTEGYGMTIPLLTGVKEIKRNH